MAPYFVLSQLGPHSSPLQFCFAAFGVATSFCTYSSTSACLLRRSFVFYQCVIAAPDSLALWSPVRAFEHLKHRQLFFCRCSGAATTMSCFIYSSSSRCSALRCVSIPVVAIQIRTARIYHRIIFKKVQTTAVQYLVGCPGEGVQLIITYSSMSTPIAYEIKSMNRPIIRATQWHR